MTGGDPLPVAPLSVAAPPVAPLLVAIDGPAGSGKSSVSREAATRLGFGILDTGAAYRALAWLATDRGVDLSSEDALMALLDTWIFQITLRGPQRVDVGVRGQGRGTDVTVAIRTPELSAQVSRVSRHPAVRSRLNALFRKIVEESDLPGVVIEGRDITTVVAPDAPVRLLLTASAEVRAARRAGELPGASTAEVQADLAARDAKDAQVVDFFTPAPGVTLIDTSDLNFDQAVTAVTDAVQAAPHQPLQSAPEPGENTR